MTAPFIGLTVQIWPGPCTFRECGGNMKTLRIFTVLTITSLFSFTAMPKSFSKREMRTYNMKLISQMIKAVSPELNAKKRDRIAMSLYQASKQYMVDPKIIIAIIDTESDFRQNVVSSTGDLSLAQINTEIWNKEFVRMGLDKINVKLLKKDEAYALSKMGKILNILKTRHAGSDSQWYARYHSHTKSLKNIYQKKVETRLRKIASVEVAGL